MSESLCPESTDEFFADEGDSPLKLMTIFTGEFFLRQVNYPVVVEMWDKCKVGRKRVAYHAAFTAAERTVLSRWQTRFRRWYLVSGTPQRIAIRPRTLMLLQRAVNFFGTI